MKKTVSIITAIMVTINIMPLSAGAAEYNKNFFTDGELNTTPDFKYGYINIGNLIIHENFEPSPGQDLVNKRQVTQYTETGGNKYFGIRTDESSTAGLNRGNMVELGMRTYNDVVLEEGTLYKLSMRIKVPEASINGKTGVAMLVPNKVNNAYDPILCDMFGTPTDLYPDGNIADKRKEFQNMTGYTQNLPADEWTTLETYYKISDTGTSEKVFSVSLCTDTNRLKGFEFFIDDIRLEAVNPTVELLRIKSAGGDDSFELVIPERNEPDVVCGYYAELRVNGTEIYDDVDGKFALLSFPADNGFKGVAIENNKLRVTADAVRSTIRLIAVLKDGTMVYRDINLVPKNQSPEIKKLKIYKENGYIKYSYNFYDPNSKDEGESEVKWLYSASRDGAFDYITPCGDFVNSVYGEGYLRVEVRPVNTDGITGNAVTSESIKVSDTAPTASEVNLSGRYYQNEVITVDYRYDSENLYDEGDTDIVWYLSDNMYGEYKQADASNSKSYRLKSSDTGKYIKCIITPRTDVPRLTGEAYSSLPYGPVKEKADRFSDYSPDYFEGTHNLISDPSFENDTVKTVKVLKDGRYVNNYAYEGASLYSEEALPISLSDESIDGSRSLKISSTGKSSASFECTAESGKLYVFSAWVKSVTKDSGNNDNIKMSLQAKEDGNESVYARIMNKDYSKPFSALSRPPVTDETTYNNNAVISDRSWTKITRIFYLIPNDDGTKRQQKLSLGLVPKGDDTEYYIDDVYIGEASENTYSLDFDLCDGTVYSEAETQVTEYCSAVLKCGDTIYRNQKYTYSLTEAPEGVSIDENTGELTVNPGVSGEATVKAVCNIDSAGIEFSNQKTIAIEQYVSAYVDGIYLDGTLADGFERNRESYFKRVDSLSDIPEITYVADESFNVTLSSVKYDNCTVYTVQAENSGTVKKYNIYFYTVRSGYENIFTYSDFESGYRYFNKQGIDIEDNIVHKGNFSAKMTSPYGEARKGLTVKLRKGKKYIFDAWIYIPDNANNELYFYLDSQDPSSSSKAYIYDDNFNLYEGESTGEASDKTKRFEKGKWINVSRVISSGGESELCAFDFGFSAKGATVVYIDDVYIAELKDSEPINGIIESQNVTDGYVSVQYRTENEAMVYTVLKTDSAVLDNVSLIAAEYDKDTGRLRDVLTEKQYSDSGFYILRIPVEKDSELKTFLWTGLGSMIPLPYNP